MSNKQYIISTDTLKTIFQGAIGAITLGTFQQYNSNKIMELNNDKIMIEQKYNLDKLENNYTLKINELKNEHKIEINEHKRIIDDLTKRLNNIEKSNSQRWF